jgi:DNA invertase Pin-like site-specific DNA recombinase
MILPRSTTDFCLACACAMSEAELFVMRARLQGGILNKARRGALKLTLPIGLCYTEEDAIVLDPDVQVQASIGEVFRSVAHTVCSVRNGSSLSQTARAVSAASP